MPRSSGSLSLVLEKAREARLKEERAKARRAQRRQAKRAKRLADAGERPATSTASAAPVPDDQVELEKVPDQLGDRNIAPNNKQTAPQATTAAARSATAAPLPQTPTRLQPAAPTAAPSSTPASRSPPGNTSAPPLATPATPTTRVLPTISTPPPAAKATRASAPEATGQLPSSASPEPPAGQPASSAGPSKTQPKVGTLQVQGKGESAGRSSHADIISEPATESERRNQTASRTPGHVRVEPNIQSESSDSTYDVTIGRTPFNAGEMSSEDNRELTAAKEPVAAMALIELSDSDQGSKGESISDKVEQVPQPRVGGPDCDHGSAQVFVPPAPAVKGKHVSRSTKSSGREAKVEVLARTIGDTNPIFFQVKNPTTQQFAAVLGKCDGSAGPWKGSLEQVILTFQSMFQ